MQRDYSKLLAPGVSVLLLGAVTATAVVDAVRRIEALRAGLLPVSLLVLFSVVSGALARREDRFSCPNAAICFVLVALVTLPAPAPLLVALAGGLAAAGGVQDSGGRIRSTTLAAAAVTVCIAQHFASTIAPPGHPSLPSLFMRLTLLFFFIRAFAPALALVLGESSRTSAWVTSDSWARASVETANVPLAWLIAILLAEGAWVASAVLSLLVVLGRLALLKLERALFELERTNGALAARVGELATLNAIGRQILSTMDPRAVCAILEHECRKVMEVDACLVAIADRDGGGFEVLYNRRRGHLADTSGSVLRRAGLARLVERREPLRVDDLHRHPYPGGDWIDPASRSLLAVPLVVEERVTGLLALQCRRPRVYDEHLAVLLATIAQQAAVAIENARNYEMATVDALTGFFARGYFSRRLEEEHRRVRRYGGEFALMMVDVDGFKTINDDNGHLAGDHYLGQITATIRDELRRADIPCRYGGDEFCVLLPETDLDGALAIAERVRSAVADRLVGFDGNELRTTVSIGVASFGSRNADLDLQALLREADDALYRAKRRGRDRVVPCAA